MSKRHRYAFTQSSFVPDSGLEDIWSQISTWSGVNYELSPLFKMTVPAAFERLESVPVDGEVHFATWVLLFGFLPVDRHQFALIGLEATHFFDERSSNMNMSVWTHKRTLTQRDGGVDVTDQCMFEPRVPLLGGLLQLVFKNVFKWRHKRLLDLFSARA